MDRGSAASDCGRAIQVRERQSTFPRRAFHCDVADDVDLPALHISKVVR